MTKREFLNQIEIRVNGGVSIEKLVKHLSENADIEGLVKAANAEYRSGKPVVDDWVYDNVLIAALKIAKPDSAFLKEVEPEPEVLFGKTVELPERMLSTNKAYSVAEIEKWARDVVNVGRSLGIRDSDIIFRVTPKLDGYAAYDDGERLYTRGNGRQGTDITRAFDRGLVAVSSSNMPIRGGGKGEIIVNKEYFQEFLSDEYENSRNVIAAVIKEGDLDRDIQIAIHAGAIVFKPFSELIGMEYDHKGLLGKIETCWGYLADNCPYDTDGLVIETTNEQIKNAMGSTNHHHRWQIAFKKNTEFHDIKVTGLQWQTAKTGRITPVVLLEPTKVSGVTISKATGHHYGNVSKNAIDRGAIVKVCRSGQVIPYISEVLKPASHFAAPSVCPSCGSPSEVEGDNLLCTNTIDCPAQIENTIEYFFKTIGTCDGFGPKVIEAINAQGYSSVSAIYEMDHRAFTDCGISAGIANNLCDELTKSESIEIEDWRFLAAFSIPLVGKGGCEKLLAHYTLDEVFDLTIEQICAIDGFAKKSAESLVKSLAKIRGEFEQLRPNFNLSQSKSVVTSSSPITGKTVVFTGSMEKGTRGDMEKHAKSLGAKVGSSVSSKTDYLVCGANVGASKTQAAEKHGVKVLLEEEYLELIAA